MPLSDAEKQQAKALGLTLDEAQQAKALGLTLDEALFAKGYHMTLERYAANKAKIVEDDDAKHTHEEAFGAALTERASYFAPYARGVRPVLETDEEAG